MKLFALLAVLLVVAVFAALMVLKKRGAGFGTIPVWPFYAKSLLTQPEQVLYHRLVKSLPEHIVLAQVQVSRVLGVKKGFKFHEWNNRINRLSYDFVVCAKDASPLAIIELDDKSHERQSRAEADQKKDQATAAAGIRLIRWNVKAMPDEAAIVAAFKQPARQGAEPLPNEPRPMVVAQVGD